MSNDNPAFFNPHKAAYLAREEGGPAYNDATVATPGLPGEPMYADLSVEEGTPREVDPEIANVNENALTRDDELRQRDALGEREVLDISDAPLDGQYDAERSLEETVAVLDDDDAQALEDDAHNVKHGVDDADEDEVEQYDPASDDVDGVNAYLASLEDEDEYNRVIEAERSGKARKGILGE